jgi:hypothetical protein
VKIDVEGYEPEVIAGAQRTLARADVVIVEYSPGLSEAGGLSNERALDQLYAAGLLPYRLGADEWTQDSPVSSRPFEGQMDVIWIRPGKGGGDGASLTPLKDKAEILNLAKVWRHLQKKAAGQSLDG